MNPYRSSPPLSPFLKTPWSSAFVQSPLEQMRSCILPLKCTAGFVSNLSLFVPLSLFVVVWLFFFVSFVSKDSISSYSWSE